MKPIERFLSSELAAQSDLAAWAKECGLEYGTDLFFEQVSDFLTQNRHYELQEYFAGREYYRQMAESLTDEPTAHGKDLEQAFQVKKKNFDSLAQISARLRELEVMLFGKSAELIAAAEVKHKPKDVDRLSAGVE